MIPIDPANMAVWLTPEGRSTGELYAINASGHTTNTELLRTSRMPTDTLNMEDSLDEDQYFYQLVKRLPGMRSVQRVPVDSVEQGIEAGTRYMSEVVRGEEPGRWAKVQKRRRDDLVPRWVDCWEAP